jgi:hypothetical protein
VLAYSFNIFGRGLFPVAESLLDVVSGVLGFPVKIVTVKQKSPKNGKEKSPTI